MTEHEFEPRYFDSRVHGLKTPSNTTASLNANLKYKNKGKPCDQITQLGTYIMKKHFMDQLCIYVKNIGTDFSFLKYTNYKTGIIVFPIQDTFES